jgi:ATP-dependent RNA helicase DeaD
MTNQFEAIGLELAIVDALLLKGYETPTPIQEKVIPILLRGGINVMGQAQTGTGKTAAFGLPILQKIQENTGIVQAIILAPTRELAVQVAEEIESFKGKKKIKVTTVYGGQSIDRQIQILNKGVEIVVGTPGRVIDLMKRKKLDISNIKYFVLDEADEMLNMGFIDDIEWILSESNDTKQVLLFSATMPTKIIKLAKKYMGEYEMVAIEKKELTTENTEQIYYSCFARDKMNIINRILQTEPDFYGIIFTNTKMNADDVTRQLTAMGIKAEALHGDIAQNQRERILQRFKDRKCTILVATDVAARGIDVNDLTHVINYSLPQDPEAYVHRIGRTGRAGKKGKAISLVEQNDYKQLLYIQSLAKIEIRKEELPSTEELIAQKKDDLRTNILTQKLSDKKDEMFMNFAMDLLSSGEAEDVLASVLKIAFSKELDKSNYVDIRQPDKLSGKSQGTQRLFVGLGKEDGYDNYKLKSYLSEKSGVDENAFLDTFCLDNFSFVTLSPTDAEMLMIVFKKEMVNGKPLISKAKDRDGGSSSGSSRRPSSSGFDRERSFSKERSGRRPRTSTSGSGSGSSFSPRSGGQGGSFSKRRSESSGSGYKKNR